MYMATVELCYYDIYFDKLFPIHIRETNTVKYERNNGNMKLIIAV